MLQPCNPDATMWLLRHVLAANPEDVDLEQVIELVAQNSSLSSSPSYGHGHTNHDKLPTRLASENSRLPEAAIGMTHMRPPHVPYPRGNRDRAHPDHYARCYVAECGVAADTPASLGAVARRV